MGIIKIIKGVNRMFPKPPIHTEADRKKRERAIVKRYGQGNAYLQIGKYKTTEDIEKHKAELASYNFMPKE